MRALLVVTIVLAAAPLARAGGDPGAGDDAFRAAATDYAARTHRVVAAWGTLHLAGDHTAQRFATLTATGGKPAREDGPIVCGSDACRGAYLIEEDARHVYLISFTDQRWGSTRAFDVDYDERPAPPPDWQDLTDVAIEHHQDHNKGTQRIRIALRAHRVVVLEMHDEVRAGEIDDVFARDVRCQRRCPELAAYAKQTTLDWYMQPVVVAAARIADLTEP